MNKRNLLLEKQTAPMEKARLIAVASELSSDWMNALPIKGSELKLDDTSLRIAGGLRLGLQIVTRLVFTKINKIKYW